MRAEGLVRRTTGRHAAEELEHKATCYDIYKQLGGGYFERVTTMIGAWFLILAVAMINTHVLLWKDSRLFTSDTLKGYWYLLGPHGLVTSLAPAFLDYLRPGFHPWQHDNSADLREWEASNKQYIVHRSGAEEAPSAA